MDDFDTDDILGNFNNRKKKKNSGRKGKSAERLLCKTLMSRFNKPFSRTIGSGNRISQAQLTESAKKVFAGDICCPEDFVFSLESKCGYNEIDLDRAIDRLVKTGDKGNAALDKFLKQATKDGDRVHKKPMLCWKKDYEPWLVFIKKEHSILPVNRTYRDWAIYPLEDFLKLPDTFFFL